MKNLLFYVSLFGLLSLACPLAGHAAIYKCTDAGTLTYQDQPCENADSVEFVVASIRPQPDARSPDPIDTVPAEAKAEAPSRPHYRPPVLELGMFDTQVLNLRGWGRPTKITRSKVKRAWHEAWTYISPLDGQQRQLEFANGKLTAIE
jgi:hypothetical protein